MASLRTKNAIVCVVAGLLLAGLAIDAHSVQPPDDSGPYHQRIREAADRAPMQIGLWRGEEAAVPYSAVKLLRPNVIISRRFKNEAAGLAASLLIVQVSDARDLLGHYPPVCYVVQGYTKANTTDRDWQVGDLKITGTEYQFDKNTFKNSESRIVMNFMIMPDGSIKRDMEAVEAQAQDLRRRFYGAAQVQVLVDASYPEAVRDDIFKTLVAGNKEVIEQIRAGVKR